MNDNLIRAEKLSRRNIPVPPLLINVICSRVFHKGGFSDFPEDRLMHLVSNLLEKVRGIEDDLLNWPENIQDIIKFKV